MPNSHDLLQIEAGEPTAAKVAKIERFLGDCFFDERGIMYCMWHWDDHELRPFEPRDLEGMSTFHIRAGIGMHALNNHENSPYVSGLFLWSQVLRYRATGDDEALANAAKAFRSIEIIYELGVANGQTGFLCKPYNSTFSHETSPDQYVPIMCGLWEYGELCDDATRARIDEILPAMSDWWRLNDYKLVYFDKAGDWLHGDSLPQYGPEYAALHMMAHRITQREEYAAEARRVLELVGPYPTRFDVARQQLAATGKTNWPEKLHGYEYDVSRRGYLHLDWEVYAPIWFGMAAVAWMLENDADDRRLLEQALGNYHRQLKHHLTPDLLALYWTQTDLETEKVYPLVRGRDTDDWTKWIISFNWDLFSYQARNYWNDDIARVMHGALLAHHYAPQFSPGAQELCREMMTRLDSERLHYVLDPHQELAPTDLWLTQTLSSEMPGFVLLTYWQARCWGIEL